jgi:glycerophosphoryl diester phosphodiesterase
LQVIAHRGASSQAPENTLAAFEKALELGVDGLEMDVRETKDGELVVVHDATVTRTTNGNGRVKTKTLKQVKALDAGSWFGKSFAGETIPTLKEVLELSNNKARVFIELKAPRIEEKVLETIKQQKMLKKTVVTSFNAAYLRRVKELEPKATVGDILLLDFLAPWRNWGDFDCLLPFWPLIGDSFLKGTKKKGLEVFPWTVNDGGVMEFLSEKKVDGIITDFPRECLSLQSKIKAP